VFSHRLDRARAELTATGASALLVGPSADLRYLTGYEALPLERLTLLVVPAAGEPELLVPALEAPRATASGATDHVKLRSWTETDDPFDHVAAIVAAAGIDPAGTFAVQDRLWTSFTLRLGHAATADRQGPRRGRRAARRSAAIDASTPRCRTCCVPAGPRPRSGRDIAELILATTTRSTSSSSPRGRTGRAPTTRRATGSRGRRRRRRRHRRHADGVLLGRDPQLRHRRGAGRATPELHAVLEEAQDLACERSVPASPPRRSTPPPATTSRPPATGSLRAPHRPRHRHRGARGALHRGRQRRAGRRPAWRSRSSRASTWPDATAHASRTSSSSPTTAWNGQPPPPRTDRRHDDGVTSAADR
jgi:hypothetical protein